MNNQTIPKINKHSIYEDDLQSLLQALPTIVNEIRVYFEALFGKKIKTTSTITASALVKFEKNFKKYVDLSQQLEIADQEPLTSESARKRLLLLNELFRLIIRRIPSNQEPIDYLISFIANHSRLPSIQGSPFNANYRSKIKGLRSFTSKLLKVVPRHEIDTFLNAGLSEQQVLPPFQHAINNLSFPKVLRETQTKDTIHSVEKLKLALHVVLNDWEVLIDLVYGLVLLRGNKVPSWNLIRKYSLSNKVKIVSLDQDLFGLVKHDWVTVRNAIAHGRGIFVPSKSCIKFSDNNKTVNWAVEQTRLEAIDVYLSSITIMCVWNIIQKMVLNDFKKQIAFLRKLAQS